MTVDLATLVRELLAARAPEASICPSEVARKASPAEWRGRMDEVRAVAAVLADQGVVVITQGDDVVDVRKARGPVRIRRGERFGRG